MTRRVLLTGMAILYTCGRAVADGAPAPPPAAEAIKACIRQMDLGNKWTFDWKRLEIGAARHPRNSYEAAYAPPGTARWMAYGYPVHVVFSIDGRADIDAVYWLIGGRQRPLAGPGNLHGALSQSVKTTSLRDSISRCPSRFTRQSSERPNPPAMYRSS